MAAKASKKIVGQKAVAKKAPAKTAPAKTANLAATKRKAAKSAPPKTKKGAPAADLDLSGFPPESLLTRKIGLCLACALDVLTRHMGLSTERAQSEIRRYSPSLDELSTAAPARPYLAWPAAECPYCG